LDIGAINHAVIQSEDFKCVEGKVKRIFKRGKIKMKEIFADMFKECCEGADVEKVTEGKSWTLNGVETNSIVTKTTYQCAKCHKELELKETDLDTEERFDSDVKSLF
jgi:hypothetical protein